MTPSSERFFRAGAIFYLVAWGIHSADHVRRGLFEPAIGVQALGNLQIVLTLGFIWLLVKRHPLGPPAAVAIGVPATIGIVVAHLLPDFGIVSDSLWAPGIDAFTWFAVLLEIVGSSVLTVVGLKAWKDTDFAMPQFNSRVL